MDKYLLFNEQATAADIGDAANDVVCYPLSRFKGFTNTASDTRLHMIFEGALEGMADGDGMRTFEIIHSPSEGLLDGMPLVDIFLNEQRNNFGIGGDRILNPIVAKFKFTFKFLKIINISV